MSGNERTYSQADVLRATIAYLQTLPGDHSSILAILQDKLADLGEPKPALSPQGEPL